MLSPLIYSARRRDLSACWDPAWPGSQAFGYDPPYLYLCVGQRFWIRRMRLTAPIPGTRSARST